MAICRCGVKVDRLQNNLQCHLCEQFFHLKCCNINDDDFDLVDKKSFKCNTCLVGMRSSINRLELPIADGNNTAPAAVSVCAGDSVAVLDVDASLVQTNAPNADIITLPNYSCEINDSIANENYSLLPPDGVTLDLIFAELINLKKSNALLRSSNDSLTELVTALRDDNSKLIDRVNVMQCSIDNLRDSMKSIVNDTSPKRKKQVLAETDSTSSKPLKLLPVVSKNASNVSNTSTLKPLKVLPVVSTEVINSNVPSFAAIASAGAGSADCAARGTDVNCDGNFQVVRNKKKIRPIVMGSSANNELGVFAKMRWLHVSSFDSNVTAEEVIGYVVKHAAISASQLACRPLIKTDTDVKTLKFINFKLGVTESCFDKVFTPDMWPANIKIRQFEFFPKVLDQNIAK